MYDEYVMIYINSTQLFILHDYDRERGDLYRPTPLLPLCNVPSVEPCLESVSV